VIAERAQEGCSKFWYIIKEHDRLRRVKMAQQRLLQQMALVKPESPKHAVKPLRVAKEDKWVANKRGYLKTNV
jgi:hypothetical protein